MQYYIEGGTLPVVIVSLPAGESMISQAGGRTWFRGDIQTENTAAGGVGKSIGRVFSGERLFMSKYTARTNAEIAFASSFPGKIVPMELQPGQSIICQKSAFMCATPGVDLSIFFQRKLGAGFFGGEGFIMQKLTGPGIVFLEIDGHAVEYTLAAGERIVCDTGVMAMMDETCTMDVERVKGLGNIMFGGEGLFNTVITGPGKVCLQSMNAAQLARLLGVGKSS
ncbi:MAG: AIM24 family protein [Clostridiales bacterium]|nr:AIM24 family protein [Clostridiales bacterium]